MITREAILKDLSSNIVDVTFIKVNGERRTLKCSLDPKYLPKGTDLRHLREMHEKPENSGKVVVWDVVQGAWKSFHTDSVIYLQVADVQ